MFLAVFTRPTSSFCIPRKWRLRRVVMESSPLHYLAKHDDQAIQRATGGPPGGVDTYTTVQVIDVRVPDGCHPFHTRPSLGILVVQINFHLVMSPILGLP